MKNYAHLLLYRRDNRRAVTVGMLKQHRLAMKNARRAANGLPAKASYSEI